MSADGQVQNFTRQIDGHRSSCIYAVETALVGQPNSTIPQPKVFSPDAPVCTENLNPDIMVMKSAENRV